MLVCLATITAQAPPTPPAAIQGLVKLLGKKAKPPTDAFTRFRPAAKPVFLDELADALGQDQEQRAALREVLLQGSAAVEEKLAAAGHAHDVAAGLAFSIAFHWGLWSGSEITDRASKSLIAQLCCALDTPDFRALSDRDKQKAWEYGVGLGAFSAVMHEAAGEDQESKAGMKAFAGQVLETLLGQAPGTLKLTDAGLAEASQVPGQKPKSESPSEAHATGLALTPPPGWTSDEDGESMMLTRTLATRNENNEPLMVRVVVSKTGTAGQPEALLHRLYDQIARPLIPADATPRGVVLKQARPEVLRRFVGNGLRCHVAGAEWNKQARGFDYIGTTQGVQVLLVESGTAWYPIVVLLAGHRGPIGEGPDQREADGSVRYDWLEQLLQALRGSPSKEPLVAREELVSSWEFSDTTAGPGFSGSPTGSSLGMSVVVRNEKLDLNTDGSYRSRFAGGPGVGYAATVTQTTTGTWSLDCDARGMFLIQAKTAGTASTKRLAGMYTRADGRRVVLLLDGNQLPAVQNVSKLSTRYVEQAKAEAGVAERPNTAPATRATK